VTFSTELNGKVGVYTFCNTGDKNDSSLVTILITISVIAVEIEGSMI
jgi:hypothetical protein